MLIYVVITQTFGCRLGWLTRIFWSIMRSRSNGSSCSSGALLPSFADVCSHNKVLVFSNHSVAIRRYACNSVFCYNLQYIHCYMYISKIMVMIYYGVIVYINSEQLITCIHDHSFFQKIFQVFLIFSRFLKLHIFESIYNLELS